MSDLDTPRVVRVPTLADFMKEIPAPPEQPAPTVRLLSLHLILPPASARLNLFLQGLNAAGEIVWLAEQHDIAWLDGQPFGREAASVYIGMEALARIVADCLAAQGYRVRAGDYALPGTLSALAGRFECAHWVPQPGGTFVVEAAMSRARRAAQLPKV